jgi:plasmid maintenance system antidote protein VapI
MKTPQSPAEIVETKRKELKLTQRVLATKLGYKDPTCIAKIEAGVIKIPKDKASAFAKALGVDTDMLLEAMAAESAALSEAKPRRKYTKRAKSGKTAKSAKNAKMERKATKAAGLTPEVSVSENTAEAAIKELSVKQPAEISKPEGAQTGNSGLAQKKASLRELKRQIIDGQLDTFSEDEFDMLSRYVDFIVFSR